MSISHGYLTTDPYPAVPRNPRVPYRSAGFSYPFTMFLDSVNIFELAGVV